MRYFTADWHFGHENILDYTSRPHASISNMDDHFIQEINDQLDEDDQLFFLGDMCGPQHDIDHVRSCLEEIPCPIYRLHGNHDPEPKAVSDLTHFLGQRVEFELDLEKRDGYPVKIVLDHYPMSSWNARHHGSIHLHGHVHGEFDNRGRRRADVGVDTDEFDGAYSGISQTEILETLLSIPAPKHRDQD